MPNGRIYFPNLDGLRFIAAGLVMFWHTEHVKFELGLGGSVDLQHGNLVGHLGVILFFVLSGFLITYLLLEEERDQGKINVKDFLIRRVLRIWPLYFLVALLALFVIPFFSMLHRPVISPEEVVMNWPRKLLLYVLFLPTLIPQLSLRVPDAEHLWSIGTEEYFYLLWPFLLIAFWRFRLHLVALIFLGWPLVRFALVHGADSGSMLFRLLLAYWDLFEIDAMAIGACMAILLFRRSKALIVLLDLRLFLIVVMTTMFFMASKSLIEAIGFRILSVFFGVIILNLAANPRMARLLEWPWLRYLGRISYGLYMFHVAVAVFVVNLLIRIDKVHGLLAYPLVLLLTIAVAALSYRYFESLFLRLKSRFRPEKADIRF
jgi:peptidoglycan/LPS O-acetylase OafA/YrhL